MNDIVIFLGFLAFASSIPIAGYLLLSGLFGRSLPITALERMAYSFALGIGSLDFSIITFGTAGLTLSGPIMLAALFAFPLLAVLVRSIFDASTHQNKKRPFHPTPEQIHFTSPEWKLFLFLFGLTLLLKTIFLAEAGLPTATDLGHHMYWSKMIVETERLPDYSKREIIKNGNGHVFLSDPEPIADFIIGEHIPFAAIAKLSGASFFSAFPVSFLLIVNMFSLIALFVFSVRLANSILPRTGLSPISVGLAVLLFAGPLFAFSSPEAKFVSGGVIGNVFGNVFIPLILLSFLRAFIGADSRFLAIGILLSFTLAYTHHLSSLVLAFILIGVAFSMIVTSPRTVPDLLKRIFRLFRSPLPWVALAFATVFFTMIAAPTYIETNAVKTAVGTPSKTTRTGLTFLQASESAGTARMAIGLAALVLFSAIRPIRRSPAFPFVLGWSGILLVMTLRPQWVFLDIPSNRIGTYLSFPFAVLSGLFLAAFPSLFRTTNPSSSATSVPGKAFLFISLVLFTFAAWSGSQDNQSSLPGAGKAQDTLEVFGATRYLADHPMPNDLFLKDHNYLVADAWMKLFFMHDYAYPLSRGYFKRYEDETNPREQCTLLMISVPNLPEGRACYEDLDVNLVAVHPAYDTAQFEKSHDFSRIYSGTTVHIYERNQ
ncbi:MAG: MFS transporter [Candidatus Moranbacteria bacterium]|nr:MFS transporter [Candidatus Moranbacteria bacterium]